MSEAIPCHTPSDVLQQRRARLAELVPGPILLAGHGELPRNYLANPHRFRQDSTFLYFVGLAMPGAAAVIEDGRTTLYLPAEDPGDVLWHGEVPSHVDLARAVGADAVAPISALLPADRHALPMADSAANRQAAAWSQRPLDPARPVATASPELLAAVVTLRSVRDSSDLLAMRHALVVTERAHRAAMAATVPGLSEFKLAGIVDGCIQQAGMVPAYGTICTVRGEVLHGRPTIRCIGDGQLLLLDAGAEEPGGFASDITRTWPVSGRFTERQAAVYDAVLAAQEASIALVRPGVRYRDVHLASCRVLASFLRDEGLLRGEVDGLVEQGAHAAFFPHGVGHLLGLDVHDLELYGDAASYPAGRERSAQFGLSYLRLDRDLEPGMVVTIEPGLYFVPAILNDPRLRERLGGAVDWSAACDWLPFGGIRIEDDVLCADEGPVVLSETIPKQRADLEVLIGAELD